MEESKRVKWSLLLLSLVCGCGENDFPRITSRKAVDAETERTIQEVARYASDQIDVWFEHHRHAGPYGLAGKTQISIGTPEEVTKICDPHGSWAAQDLEVAGCVMTPYRILLDGTRVNCPLVSHELFHLAFVRLLGDYDSDHSEIDYPTTTEKLCEGMHGN